MKRLGHGGFKIVDTEESEPHLTKMHTSWENVA